jgi:hypothetical protein
MVEAVFGPEGIFLKQLAVADMPPERTGSSIALAGNAGLQSSYEQSSLAEDM